MNKQPETLAEPVMPVEPDNHHNALLCPYCRPGLEERIERLVDARLAAERDRAAEEALAPLRARIATCGHVEEPWPEGCWPCEVRALLPAEETP